jgi:hypothetical protein
MLLENPSVWDVWWHGSSTADRVVITAFAAIVLGILASALGYQVDQAQAPGSNDVKPDSRPRPGDGNLTETGVGDTDATNVISGTFTAPDPAVSSDTQLTPASLPANAGDTSRVMAPIPKGASVASVSGQPAYSDGDDDSPGSL